MQGNQWFQFVLRLSDLMKGTDVKKYYRIYSQLEKGNPEEIHHYRLNKLRSLVSYAFTMVPYYRDTATALKLTPDDFRSFEDLAKLPLLTREVIQEQGERLYSTEYKSKKTFKGSSSGSTGTPIKYIHDKDAESSSVAALYKEMEHCGWDFSQKGIHVWGNNDSIKQWNKASSKIKSRLFNKLNIASPLIDQEEELPLLIKKIKDYAPQYADGYPNSLVSLAEYCDKNRENLTFRNIFTTAENYSANQKHQLEKVFNAKVYDFYGCGEINSIAAQKDNTGRYYIFSPRVHVEVIDNNNDWKELVITDLDNRLMPFLRYCPGDLADGIYPDEKQPHLQYFNKLIGRVSDVITLTDGRKIHPVHVFGGTAFRRFPQISKHKVTWDGTVIRFYFEANDPPDQKALEELIISLLADYNLDYEIIMTSKLLPGKSGKFRYFERITTQ